MPRSSATVRELEAVRSTGSGSSRVGRIGVQRCRKTRDARVDTSRGRAAATLVESLSRQEQALAARVSLSRGISFETTHG